MGKFYENMHNLFTLQKTLRFELKPVGKTNEYFTESILNSDELKAETFKKVKKYCDEYHKKFIQECLENYNDERFIELLKEYSSLLNKSNLTEEEKSNFENLQTTLRNLISDLFTKSSKYKGLFGKELIKEYLKDYYKDNPDTLKEIMLFEEFTSYFTGFNTNRANMYSKDEKHTAIAYRLIDENLSIYMKNIVIFKKVSEEITDITKQIKDNLGFDCDNYFKDVENYIHTLSQAQIDEYNLIISGKTEKNNVKVQGLNELINLYNQKHGTKLPKFKELYKQILSDTNSISFKFDLIEYDYQIIDMIKGYYDVFKTKILENDEFKISISSISKFNTEEIYINNDISLTTLSQNVYGDWNYIQNLLEIEYDNTAASKSQNSEKYYDKRKSELEKIKEISIGKIERLIATYDKESGNSNKIEEYFKATIENLLYIISSQYEDVKPILDNQYSETSMALLQDKKSVEKIKNFLDEIKKLQNCVKIIIPKNKLIGDSEFYNTLNYEVLEEILPIYNKTRNYLTKKPYSLEKFKLNFNCPTLLNGWDTNKEKDNLGVLFKKDGNFYLGIINKNHKKIFEDCELKDNTNSYQKIEYKLLPGPNKMLPKVFFSKSRIAEFEPSEDLIRKYAAGYHKKGENFDLDFCHELIDFFKMSLNKHEDWHKFNFQFSDTNSYQDISQFYKEVEFQGYKIKYTDISEEYINQLVDEGKLYLFQIYNKDFSSFSKGKPNLHTIYWRAVFDEDNLKDVVYKLNGGAEIFYRKKSIEGKITHPKNQPIDNKNPDNPKKQSVFEYDLIKDKRFTLDKFQFNVPITLNFKSKGINKFNDYVNSYLKFEQKPYVIGVDRGERHLLYISVVDNNGNIVEQCSLNKIGQTNYHTLLDKKEAERDKARKSWNTIQNIKELKEGYMSQVVHVITQLMLKYNAIVVLEDLNSGFKNSRKKVEKQVYDKFETKLIDKLAYLVDKSVENKFAEGGIMKAYQFANSDIKNSKQNGLILYIPAWCTSKIDPITGFVSQFNLKKINKDFVEKFDSITFNEKEKYFEFNFDYRKFTDKATGDRYNWTLCTYGDRIRTFRNPDKNSSWDNQTVDLCTEFISLFDRYKIDYSNIKTEIINKADSKFFNALPEKDNFYGFNILFKLLVQLRNSVTGSEEDYILSPVKNRKGFFYDSRENNNILPENADANGAYNIARKGLMILDRLKNTEVGAKVNYSIKNVDWLNYVEAQDVE